MKKHLQVVAFAVGLAACAAAPALPVLLDGGPSRATAAALPLLALGAAAILYAAGRGLRFQGKLRRFVRHLLAGNYDAGVTVTLPRDEIHALEGDLERLGEQLRAYDQLRADRVRSVQLLLDLVMDQVRQPLMLADIPKAALECNPAMQALLGIGQRRLSLPAITKLPANAAFNRLFEQAVALEKSPQTAPVTLQAPGSAAACALDLTCIPVKNSEGEVEYALLLQKAD